MSLLDVLGSSPATCGHKIDTGSILYVVPEETDDFAFIATRLQLDPQVVTAVRVCWECADLLPSQRKKAEESASRARRKQENEDEELRDKIAEARGGEVFYRCGECDNLIPQSDLVQVRHCSHCEENFNGTDAGRNCENCNRPFSSKLTDEGCGDCLSDDPCEEVDVAALIKLALESYAFEIDGLPVAGAELVKNEGLLRGELESLYDLEVDGFAQIGTGKLTPQVKVYRRGLKSD